MVRLGVEDLAKIAVLGLLSVTELSVMCSTERLPLGVLRYSRPGPELVMTTFHVDLRLHGPPLRQVEEGPRASTMPHGDSGHPSVSGWAGIRLPATQPERVVEGDRRRPEIDACVRGAASAFDDTRIRR